MPEPSLLFSAFLALCAAGACSTALFPDRHNPLVLATISSLAAFVILFASGNVLLSGNSFHVSLWNIPSLGTMVLKMDRLSALFVFLAGLIYLPVSIYSASYMKRYSGLYSLRSFGILYNLLFAFIVLLLSAGDIFSFLLTWEIMSILSYFLVNYEHEKEENTKAGYLMLVMSEAGTLAVALAFLILAGVSGALDFSSLKSSSGGLGAGSCWAVFLLSFLGSESRPGSSRPMHGFPGPIRRQPGISLRSSRLLS